MTVAEALADVDARLGSGPATELVLVPECFAFLGPEQGKLELAETLGGDGPIWERCAGLARSVGCDVVFGGFWERGSTKTHVFNTCVHIGPDGGVRAAYRKVHLFDVDLTGTILKASMVVSGKDCPEQASVEEVAEATLTCLKSTVPAILPGIVFLSGGQSDVDATRHLNLMNQLGPNPWPLSFSYGRAMQSAALKLWSQDLNANFASAQKIVAQRARENGLAALGRWNKAA